MSRLLVSPCTSLLPVKQVADVVVDVQEQSLVFEVSGKLALDVGVLQVLEGSTAQHLIHRVEILF